MSFITRLKALLPSFSSNTGNNASQSPNPTSTPISSDKSTSGPYPSPMPDIGTQTKISAAPKDNIVVIPSRGDDEMAANMDGKSWHDCLKIIDQYPGWDADKQLLAEAAEGTEQSTVGSSKGGTTPPTPGSGRRAYFGSSPPLLEGHGDVEMRDADAAEEGSQDVVELVGGAKTVSEDAELLPSLGLGESPEYVQTPGDPYSMGEHIAIGIEAEVTQPPSAASAPTITRPTAGAPQQAAEQLESDFEVIQQPAFPPPTTSENSSSASDRLASEQTTKSDPTVSQAPPATSPTLESLLPGITSQTEVSPPQPKVVHPPQAATTFSQPASPGFPYAIQPVAAAVPGFQAPTIAQQQVQDSRDLQLLPSGQVGSSVDFNVTARTDSAAATSTSAPPGPSTTPIAASLSQPQQAPPPDILTYAPAQQIDITADSSPELAPQQGNDQVIDSAPLPAMPVKLPETFRAAVLEEAIAKGATEDEQHLIMQGLRSVERNGSMQELGGIEGAMEVDASELPEVEDNDDVDVVAPSPEPEHATKGRGRKRKSEGASAGTKKKTKAAEIPALTNEEHLASGWEYQPRSHFQSMKVPELNKFIRAVASQSRWYNGLNKKGYVDKIMEWQEEMRVLQEGGGEDDSSDEEEDEDLLPTVVASRASTSQPASRHPSIAPRTSKSKSRTPATTASETSADQATTTAGLQQSSVSSDRSMFFDPAASPRSTKLLHKLQAVKQDDDQGADNIDQNDESDEIPVLSAQKARRSRSKTADSAKHGVRGGNRKTSTVPENQASKAADAKKGAKRQTKILEPDGAEVKAPARSLRRRTASVAPEGYGA